jgi:hypothetical protein
MSAMDWLLLLREALDAAHEDHDEGCDCYYRLSDGLDGVYRFPERSHGPPRAPVYGCKTPIQAACDRISKGMIGCPLRRILASALGVGLAIAMIAMLELQRLVAEIDDEERRTGVRVKTSPEKPYAWADGDPR